MNILLTVAALLAAGRDWIDYLTLAVSTCLLTVGFFGVRYAKRTLRNIERQTGASEDASIAARGAAEASLKTAESFIHAERAWVLAELGWYDEPGRVSHGSSRIGEGDQTYSVNVHVKLTCKNEGRSPAWIDHVYARADMVEKASDIESFTREECQSFGPMEPIGVSGEISRGLSLDCDGYLEDGKYISISVIVAYHDIFGVPRLTTMGYSLIRGQLYKQQALPHRNRNT
jgi:hypothetical protein